MHFHYLSLFFKKLVVGVKSLKNTELERDEKEHPYEFAMNAIAVFFAVMLILTATCFTPKLAQTRVWHGGFPDRRHLS